MIRRKGEDVNSGSRVEQARARIGTLTLTCLHDSMRSRASGAARAGAFDSAPRVASVTPRVSRVCVPAVCQDAEATGLDGLRHAKGYTPGDNLQKTFSF